MVAFFRERFQRLSAPIASVSGAALVLAVFGIASRLLGLGRDRILASRFGAGDTLDVYYAAFRIPDLLYGLLVLGALSAAFIPVFAEARHKESEERAQQVASSVFVLLIVAIGALAAAAAVCMPYISPLIAPGFDGVKTEALIFFSRIMLLSPVFLAASAVFGGILISRGAFFTYSLAPIFYNLGIIFGALVLVSFFGVAGLAWGVVLGAFLHGVVQYAAAKYTGFRWSFSGVGTIFRDAYVRSILRLMFPRTLAAATNEINFLVITIFASVLASGSLAVFHFANNLQMLPVALFGISFAVAVFPKLSSVSARGDTEEFIRVFSKTLRRILYFVVPLSVLFLVLRSQVVRVVLGAGQFDWEDTVYTFQVFGILSVSLFAQGLLPLLARAFYSLKDTKTPFFIALASQFLNVALVFVGMMLLSDENKLYGLAAAFSVSSVINMTLLLLFLKKRLGHLENGKTSASVIKVTVAAVCAGLGAQIVKGFWGSVTDLDTFWEVLIQLVFSGVSGVGVYLAVSALLGVEEFHDFRRSLLVRVFGSPRAVAASEEKGIQSP